MGVVSSVFVWLIFICQTSVCKTEEEQLIKVFTKDCICPGDVVTYECTVIGGQGGTTVWQGDAFHCPNSNHMIQLVQGHFTSAEKESGECNDGAIVGRGIRVENNSYTSQLNVTLTSDLAGESIECIHDDGMITTKIGSLNITLTADQELGAILFPPDNISWMADCLQSDLAFNWSPVATDCPAINYNIQKSNCGSCPTTTTHTTVTCTDIPTDGSMCTFAVQTIVCGNISSDPREVSVTPRCPMTYQDDASGNKQLLFTIACTVPSVLVVVLLVLAAIIPLLLRFSKRKGFLTDSWSSWRSATQNQSTVSHKEEFERCGDDIENDSTILKILDNENNGTYYGLEELAIAYAQCKTSTQGYMEEPLHLDSLLVKVKGQVSSHWYHFGLAIGVPEDIMEQLRDYSEMDGLVEILDYWLRHHPGQPTWQEVDNALREAEQYRVDSDNRPGP